MTLAAESNRPVVKDGIGAVSANGEVLVNQVERVLMRAADAKRSSSRPCVTVSYAQSLDGSIAARPGKRLVLSGSQSMLMTHKVRALHDAILVGVGTVLTDNPRLTVRMAKGNNPRPVILDSRLRTPLSSLLLSGPPVSPWIVAGINADPLRQAALERKNVRILRLPSNNDGRIDLSALMERLAALGVRSLMVEGGARVITSFYNARLVDQVLLTIAPVLIGGFNAIDVSRNSLPASLPRLTNLFYHRMGDDMVLRGDPQWDR
jgi:GTP cyclohydrolase II